MDWSSDLSKLFANYKMQKQYKIGGTIDKNGDGVTDVKDLNLLKGEEKSLFSKEIKISDLVDLSTKKDIDNDGNVDENENNFFNYVKENVYNILAKNINKDNDLTVNDMVELEETIRNLDEKEKESVGQELRKLQNRMVSNLTSQFFVTKETTAYKDAAAQNVINMLDAKLDLENLTVKNNPFGDTKTLDLLNKIENRSTRTLAEKYTDDSIDEFKKTLDKTKLIEKTSKAEDVETSEGNEGVPKTGFGIGKDGLVYYNGDKYTGSEYPTNPGKYYQEGKLLTGQASDGRYFCLGNIANGPITSDWEINSTSQTKSRTITTCTAGYKTKEVVETKSNDDNETLISEEITQYGDNHKKKSCEVRTYDSKGNYDCEIITYESNGITEKSKEKFKYDNKNDKYNGEYTNSDGKKLIYLDGMLYTGIYDIDKKYYEDGEIKAKAVGSDGKIYLNGIIAQGVNKEDNNITSFYKDGVLVISTASESDNVYTETDKTSFENAIKYIEKFKIKNVDFKLNGDKYSFNEFKGSQDIDYAWRNVEYKFDSEKGEMESSIAYASDIKLVNTFKVDENQRIITLLDAKYDLNGTIVDVAEDGTKAENGIDYSLQFADADGVHTKVLISEALSDGITLVREYTLDNDGKYNQNSVQIQTNSIGNIQKGLSYDVFNIETGKEEITYAITNDELKINDKTLSGVEVELLYNAKDGSYKSGIITFNSEGVEPITLNADDSYRIKDNKLYVAKAVKDGNDNIISYDVTTYNINGTKDDTRNIPDENGVLTALLYKINLKISADISEVVYAQGSTSVSSFKYEGVKYNVTDESGVVTIESEDKTIKKQYKNNIAIFEKYPGIGNTFVTVERNESGVQKSYKNENSDGSYSLYEYSESGKISKEIYFNKGEEENIKTEKSYDDEGKCIVEIIINTYAARTDEETVKKTETYVGSDTENNWTQKTTVEGDTTTVEKKDIDGNLTSKVATKVEEGKVTVTSYNVTTEKISEVRIIEDNKETIKLYSAETETVLTTTVFENGVTSVYNGDSTATSALKSKTIITGTTKVEESNFSDGKPSLIEHYENNKLSMKEELDASATLQQDESRKYNVTKFKEDGTTVDKTGVKTVKENGTAIIKWNGANGQEVEEEIGSSGITISEIQKSFAQSRGFTIKDVIIENEEEVLIGTYTLGNGEDKTVKYSNIAVKNGGFSYTAISDISKNITLKIMVENDIQKSAKIIFNGSEFDVNVNGAAINDNIDAQIKTFDINGVTGIVNIADVISDGIIRNRELYMENGAVKCREILILGNINTVYQNVNKVSDVKAPSISGESLNYDVMQNGNIKITGEVLFKPNNKNDEGTLYTITSNDEMKIEKGATPKLHIALKDKSTIDYEFNSDGSYIVTTGVVKETYNIEGEKVKLIVGQSEINEGAELKKEDSSIIVSKDDKYELKFSNETGDIESAKLIFLRSFKTLENAQSVVIDGDYAIVRYEDKIEIYNKFGDDINEELNLNLDTYEIYKEISDAYKTLTGKSINLESIDTTKRIIVDEDTIKIPTKDNKTINIKYDENMKIQEYAVSEEKTNSEIGIKYEISKNYDTENNIIGGVCNVDEKVFTLPCDYSIQESGQNIILDYTLDDEEYTVTVKYKQETSQEDETETEKTKYTIDTIIVKKGENTQEIILDVSKSSFKLRNDGEWVVE